MPNLSQFYGITILMYFLGSEHNPPHIHAFYGRHQAIFIVKTGEIASGKFPPKATALVREWLALHREELMTIWQTQKFKKIKPLE